MEEGRIEQEEPEAGEADASVDAVETDDTASSEAPESTPQDLFSYKRIELRCVTDLRRLRDVAGKLELNQSILELTDDVLQRVENKCFSIAVVGEFKRGKSTFINALLGREILPADILPCSATLNRVTYGLKPSVSIHYKSDDDGPQRVEEIGIDQLEDYVTKLTPESEQTASQIAEAVVHYPSDYCRNNVDIIDTPGLNDDETMTEVTMAVVPKVDAAILVIMPESPFSGYEGDFLTNHLLLQDLGRVMFVVTAIDRLRRDKDRDRIVQVIEDRIAKAVEARLQEQFEPGSEDFRTFRQQIGPPHVFPLSAYQALEAAEDNDAELLETSRFPKFTSALEEFLTHTRGAIELQVLANRIMGTGDEIVKRITIELGALDMAQQEFDDAYERALRELASLRRRREEELANIDEAEKRTKKRLEPMVGHLEDDIRKAAEAVIDDAAVTAEEIKKDRVGELTERLGKQVSDAVSQSARRSGERLQIEIERDLQMEIERLYDFANTVGETLHGIEMRFGSVEADASAKHSAGAESLAAAISVFTGFGGIWSGYREAGLKGAAVGGVASVGTAIVGFKIAALAGLTTLSLPLILVLGAASFITGGFAAQRLFGADRVDRFKSNYKSALLERLDEQLQEEHLDRKVMENVHELYDALKDKLVGELTVSIDQTQSTLDDLRDKKASDESLSEHKREESQEIRDEVQGIRAKALRLSNQLAEITSV